MARFRDSVPPEGASPVMPPAPRETAPPPDTGATAALDRSIGDIIAETRNLSVEQVEQVLAYQRQHGVRFGEAAVALKLVTRDDVMFALAQQFHYPYAPEEQRKLSPELVALNQPFGVQAEAFRAMRSQMIVRVFTEDGPARALAVISPEAGDGKTYVAANLAVTLAQLGGRTLLVDADLRHPRQHEVFRLDNRVGLSGILSGRSDSHVIKQIAAVPSLFVLPVGVTPPNPLELVERPAFALLMRELIAKFDHVIVDTPAAANGSDSSVIAARCGAAVMIARKNRSRMAALADLGAMFDAGGTRMAGVIVNEY